VISPRPTPTNSEAAVEAVFADSYLTVVRAAYLVVGDQEEACELAQDAFVQLLRHWRRVSTHDNPGAWVRLVAIRLAVKARKRAARPGPPPAVPAYAVPNGDRVDVERALAQLPTMQRAAVVLHYLEDLSTDEVARALGCRPATARVHLHRARARLAELLVAGEPPEEVARVRP
jgi:DNA-directed RNA polymerase specialized sigma24 family protein